MTRNALPQIPLGGQAYTSHDVALRLIGSDNAVGKRDFGAGWQLRLDERSRLGWSDPRGNPGKLLVRSAGHDPHPVEVALQASFHKERNFDESLGDRPDAREDSRVRHRVHFATNVRVSEGPAQSLGSDGRGDSQEGREKFLNIPVEEDFAGDPIGRRDWKTHFAEVTEDGRLAFADSPRDGDPQHALSMKDPARLRQPS